MNDLKDRFVVFDLETTNNPAQNQRHEIIEIAAIEIRDGKINANKSYHSLVRPPCKIQPHNYRVSGISDEMVKNASVVSEKLPHLLEFIADSPIVGHNISFDVRILNENIVALSCSTISNMLIDTLALSRKIYKTEKKHDLDTVMDRLDIKVSGEKRHRAIGDVERTGIVFLKFLEHMQPYGIVKLEHLDRFCNTDSNIEDFQQLTLF